MVVDTTEVWEPLSATDIDAEIKEVASPPPTPDDKTRYCACGCGEIVKGSATLKRGHTLAPGISRQWDASDLLVVQTAIVMMLLAITSWLENNRGIVHMEMEEAQAIANPIGRIVARHFPIKKALPGDVADVFAIASAVFAYTLRVTDAKGKKATNAPNGSNSNIPGGYGPLEQYAYNPSNYQPPKSENGNPN